MSDALDSPGVAEHLRRIRAGETDSWTWLVERYSPLLELQASYRLGAGLRQLYDVQDLVNDVWMAAFPRLPDLAIEDRSAAPQVLRYLSAILLHKVADLVRKHIRRDGVEKELARRRCGSITDGLGSVQDSCTTVLTRAARSEARAAMRSCLADLRPDEQVLLVLRFVEGLSVMDIARKLDEPVSTVSMRCARLLPRLRTCFPATLVDELGR